MDREYDEIIIDKEEWRDNNPKIIDGVEGYLKYLIMEYLKIIKEKFKIYLLKTSWLKNLL